MHTVVILRILHIVLFEMLPSMLCYLVYQIVIRNKSDLISITEGHIP